MGAEVLIPIALSLAAGGVQQYNTNKTAKKRDRDIARGIIDSGKQQQAADQRIGRNLDELEVSRSEPFKDTLQGQFINRINASRQLGLSNLDRGGGVSDAFTEGVGGAKTGAIDYAGVIANLLAGVDAPGNQRQAEQKGKGDTGMDLLRFKRNADQDTFLAELRARRHRDNPWLAIGASGLSGLASGMAGSGFGGSPGAAVPGISGTSAVPIGVNPNPNIFNNPPPRI